MRSPVSWMKSKLRRQHVARYEKRAQQRRGPAKVSVPYSGPNVIRPVGMKREPTVAEIRLKKRRAANKVARASRKRNRGR